ncbi:MAG TPA: DUF167 domain-containing protein [Luteitalea sp.]|nr:DUF167 domain-containing protein [Luteitalea sp.]
MAIRGIPRAGRSGIGGVRDEALLVRLAAAPVDGAANVELVEVLADAFGVARRQVTLVSGARSRSKRVRIDGIQAAAVSAVIAAVGSHR